MARQVLTIPDVPPTLLQSATAAATYVAKAGDVMTGTLGVFLTGTAVQAQRVADSYPRVVLGTNVNSAGGGIEFGSGSVGLDTRIFRNGPAQLQTNAQWDNNLVLKESSAWAFRHGASNFGTPIYAQFGYAGDGNNPRMQFGCNAWFAPYGGTRPNPTKQVSGLASGLIVVEAGGSGGQEAGRVPLADFIWQDGGWTTSYVTPMRLYNGGSIDLTGDRPFLAIRYTGQAAAARFGQAVNAPRLDLSVNGRYDGTNWLRDDTTKGGAWLYMNAGATAGDNFMIVQTALAGANPVTPVNRLTLNGGGTLIVAPDSYGTGIEVLGTVSVQGNNVMVGPRGNNPAAGGRVIYYDDGGTLHWSSGLLAVGGARDFVVYDFVTGRHALTLGATTGTLTLSPAAGTAAIHAAGSVRVPVSKGDGNAYSLDAGQSGPDAAGYSLANGTVFTPFGNVAGGFFSGMFLVNDTSNGTISLWLQGGGGMYKVGGAGQHVNAVPTAGQLGVYLGGIGNLNIVIHNNMGGTIDVRVMSFRSRQNT